MVAEWTGRGELMYSFDSKVALQYPGGGPMTGRQSKSSDPRELPAYTISEAAHYLAVPAATIRYWSVGRYQYEPLIQVPRLVPTLLSFLNLTELHVLAAIRREHEVKMPSVRKAVQYLAEHALSLIHI